MPINKKRILEAKFKRDYKLSGKTFLVDYLDEKTKKEFIDVTKNIPLEQGEQMIIFFYLDPSRWYLISDKRIIQQIQTTVDFIRLDTVLGIKSPLSRSHFLDEKKLGLNYIELILKTGEIYRLEVEKGSFSVMDGIISYLVSN